MGAILLALASSLGYGGSDFAGGLASRDAHVLRVVAVAAPAGLLVNLLLLPIIGADWSTAAIAWGAGSGLASAAAFTLLYRTLALGPMSVLSPLTAVISAVIPVGVGLLEGERLGTPAFAGLVTAVLAIILVGGGPSAESSRPGRLALVLAIGAGAAIAAQLICLHQAPAGSGLAPLLAGSVVSSSVLSGCRRDPAPAHRDDTATLVAGGWVWGPQRACEPGLPAGRPVRRPLHRGSYHCSVSRRHGRAGVGRAGRTAPVGPGRRSRGGRPRRVAARSRLASAAGVPGPRPVMRGYPAPCREDVERGVLSPVVAGVPGCPQMLARRPPARTATADPRRPQPAAAAARGSPRPRRSARRRGAPRNRTARNPRSAAASTFGSASSMNTVVAGVRRYRSTRTR